MTALRSSAKLSWAVYAAAFLYLLVLGLGMWRSYPHLHVLLLILQYALLLPLLAGWLKSERNQGTQLQHPLLSLRWLIVCFVLAATSLSWLETQGLNIPDELGYLFQARLYLSGHLMAAPLIGASANVRETPAELFFANHILTPSGWYAKYPPGWPLVLAVGQALHAKWLVTPVLSALLLLVVAKIGKKYFSPLTGRMAIIFAIFSPFYLVNSIGMMSHAFCALLAATACLCLFRGLVEKQALCFAGMFACLAAAFQVRPYTAFAITLVMTIAALWCSRQEPRLVPQILAVGAVFGTLAVVGILIYNHLYTGHWLVSPYAYAAGSQAPPELSFNPAQMWQGIVQYGQQGLEENLFGAFPFIFLLAAYTTLRENKYRREVNILTALYTIIVLAYLAHPEGSGIFFGERFHFEAYFAILILGARGFALLAERWKSSRTSLTQALAVLILIQVFTQGTVALAVSRRGRPYRRVRTAVMQPDVQGLVLLHDSPGFVGKHFNINEPDWRNAKRLFLVDADPEERAKWACLYGFSTWTVAAYNPQSDSAVLTSGQTSCPAQLAH